jgi:hypothetical protein
MAEGDVLFWVEDTFYGCKQPVRSGDLLRVKDHGWGWREGGKVVMVLDVIDTTYTHFVSDHPDDLFPPDEPEECLVLIEGRREAMRIEYLEPLTD